MSILIDGYNLLNAVGITGRGNKPSSLERSRTALLDFLAGVIDSAEISHTTIVFDARQAPPGLPHTVRHRGLTVRFAAKHEDADTLIEELILTDTSPRRLTVVSSDHRLQRAARRRKARAVDADVWFVEAVRRHRQQEESDTTFAARPPVPLLEEQVQYWLRQFGGQESLRGIEAEQADDVLLGSKPADQPAPQAKPAASPSRPPAVPQDQEKPYAIENPFPPGYAEDLLRDTPIEDPQNPFPPGYGEEDSGE
jgi:predicted RNA-binding protein with PIN domain